MNELLKDILSKMKELEIKQIWIREKEIDVDFELLQFIETLKPYKDKWNLEVFAPGKRYGSGFAYMIYREKNIIYKSCVTSIETAKNIQKRYNVQCKYYE